MKKAKQAIPNKSLISERIRHGWSQQEVADRVGTTSVNVSRWERGVTAPNSYFRQQLMSLFEKNLEELGLFSQESQSPEVRNTSEQASPQLHLTTTEERQDSVSPLQEKEQDSNPSEIEIASSSIDKEEPVLIYQPSAPLPILTTPLSRFRLWRSSRYPRTSRVIILTSLVLLVVLIGLFWFNSTRGTSNGVKANGGEPVPAFYNVKGNLVLNDSFNSEQTQGGWNLNSPSKPTGCHIINGAYDMKENSSQYCLAQHPAEVTDFVYQADITLHQGSQAGLVFHVKDDQTFYYYFGLGSDGTYLCYRSDPASDGPNPIFAQKPSAAIHKGYNQSNQLGIKVLGDDISLYINSQLVYEFHDATYKSGSFGVRVLVPDGQQGATEASYRNAKVWTL